jgi:hypothetical protein
MHSKLRRDNADGQYHIDAQTHDSPTNIRDYRNHQRHEKRYAKIKPDKERCNDCHHSKIDDVNIQCQLIQLSLRQPL